MSEQHDRSRASSRADSQPDIESLARMYRLSRSSDLRQETRALIKEYLLGMLGVPEQRASPEQTVTATAESVADPVSERISRPGSVPVSASGSESGSEAESAPGFMGASADPLSAGARSEQDVPAGVEGQELLELRIRQLVEANATWERIEPAAWSLLMQHDRPEAAARFVELAFLHASDLRLAELMESLAGRYKGYYGQIHPAVRVHLVIRSWKSGAQDNIYKTLLLNKDEPWLSGPERLFVFWNLRHGRNPEPAAIYLQRYQQEISAAACEWGIHAGLLPDRYYLEAGRVLLDAGLLAEAQAMFECIDEQEPEHDEALSLVLVASETKVRHGTSHYMRQLDAARTSDQRLQLMAAFLSATRGLGGLRDRNRPALNEILREPLRLVGETPEEWASLSELLASNRDLLPLLPNLFRMFHDNVGKFHSPLLDAALWQGPLVMNADLPEQQYWKGVALLHHYVNCGPQNEASLWRSRNLVLEAVRLGNTGFPASWRELHKAALGWVSKNHLLMEADRVRVLEQMRIAADPDGVTLNDIEEYIDRSERPPALVLKQLVHIAHKRKAPGLEIRLHLKRAEQSHLTNQDISRIWYLALDKSDHDLAWRCVSILAARRCLAPQVRHAWEISGEKRSAYPVHALPKAVLEKILRASPPPLARLAYASVHVGPALPELLALLDPGASVRKVLAVPKDSVERIAQEGLDQLDWLAAPRRKYRFSFESGIGGSAVPAFYQVLTPGLWPHLVSGLCERLGVNSWGWRLSRLHDQILEIIPRIATRQDIRRHSGKVARWLKNLSPEQRAAWQDLAALGRSIDDEQARHGMATFVCRLATTMCQNHYGALTALQAMRADISVIWNLENWILSEGYSQIRRKLGTSNRVLVPNALARLTTVLVAPEPAADGPGDR